MNSPIGTNQIRSIKRERDSEGISIEVSKPAETFERPRRLSAKLPRPIKASQTARPGTSIAHDIQINENYSFTYSDDEDEVDTNTSVNKKQEQLSMHMRSMNEREKEVEARELGDDTDSMVTHINTEHDSLNTRSHVPESAPTLNQSKRTRYHAHLMLQTGSYSTASSRRSSGVPTSSSQASLYSSTVSPSAVGGSLHSVASHNSHTVGVACAFPDESFRSDEFFDDTSDLEDEDDVAFPHLTHVKERVIVPRSTQEDFSFIAATTVVSTELSCTSPVSVRSVASPTPSLYACASSPTYPYYGPVTTNASVSTSASHSSYGSYFQTCSSDNAVSGGQVYELCLETLFRVHTKYQLSPDCLHTAVYLFHRHSERRSVEDRASVASSPAHSLSYMTHCVSTSRALPSFTSINQPHSQVHSQVHSPLHSQWSVDGKLRHSQLMALASLAVACQLTHNSSTIHNFNVNQCQNELSYVNYSYEQVVEAMQTLMRQWSTEEASSLHTTTGYAHLSKLCNYLHVDDMTMHLAQYYLEQCLFHRSLLGETTPLQIAAGCLFLALCHQQAQDQRIHNRSINDSISTGDQVQGLLHVTGMSTHSVAALASEIVRFLTDQASVNHHRQSPIPLKHSSSTTGTGTGIVSSCGGFWFVYEKYSSSVHHCVSTLPLPNVV